MRFRTLAISILLVVLSTAAWSSSGTGTRRGGSARSITGTATSERSVDPKASSKILALLEQQKDELGLAAVIVKVSVGGKPVIRTALGESTTGVPATPAMHFRNGAVAISYVANLLLQLVDDGKIRLDDKVSKYLPDVPHADQVTIDQLARMTSGYRDYVANPKFVDAFLADPFRNWTTAELLKLGADDPLWFEPGTNWSYAHTNYVLLGLVIEKVTGRPMEEVMQQRVLDPLGLTGTHATQTSEIPEPALHAFDSERREFLQIPAGVPFYEESSYWNPSWTITRGAVQTSTIDDLDRTAIAIGSGKLLSRKSYALMSSKDLIGFGAPVEGCRTCAPQTPIYTYGIGVVSTGDWLTQNPQFGGYAAVESYLPSRKIAISVAVTFAEKGFDATGSAPNRADELFRQIATLMAPDDAPPSRPS